MNIIYLSPHFPPNYYLFCVHLREQGASVLGIADVPYDQLRPELKDALTEYYRVDDMTDYDQLLRACGYFTHIYGRLDRVESHSEHWMETEARLRTDFNIPGIRPHQLARITRKSEMKRLFRNAGVAVARGRVLKNPESALNLVRETGYPLIFKPDRGVNAANTFRINNDGELNAFLDNMPSVKYVVEEFIEGTIYSFDGLTDRDGNIVFHTAHVFSQGMMETVAEDRDLFFYSLREIPEDLETAGFNTVKTFGIRERFFHIDFFRTPDNRLLGLEVNARPPTGPAMDMFNYANDIDLYKEWANVLMNRQFAANYSRPWHCGYIGRKLSKPYLHSHMDIMQRYGEMIVHHGPADSAFSDYIYIAKSPDEQTLKAGARFIQETG